MKYERAMEIVNSPGKIRVNYQDTAIWITDLDPSTNTARIKMPSNSEHIEIVPVAELTEE